MRVPLSGYSLRSRKFYVRSNSRNVDSIETERIVIAHLLPLKGFRKNNVRHAFLINDDKIYRYYFIINIVLVVCSIKRYVS